MRWMAAQKAALHWIASSPAVVARLLEPV